MSEEIKIIIDFADSEGYEPYNGDGPKARLPFEGVCKVRYRKFALGKAESSGNDTLTLTCSVAEDGLGGTLYTTIPISGTRKDGVKNVHKFFDVLTSAGWTMAQIAAFRTEGKKMDVGEIMGKLCAEGALGHVEVADDEYNGKITSKIQNFVTADQYKKRLSARTSKTAGGAAPTNGASQKPAAGGGTKRDPLEDVLSTVSK